MQDIKNCIDSLVIMNKPVNFDDLSICILNGLDPAYSKCSHALKVQETVTLSYYLNYNTQISSFFFYYKLAHLCTVKHLT